MPSVDKKRNSSGSARGSDAGEVSPRRRRSSRLQTKPVEAEAEAEATVDSEDESGIRNTAEEEVLAVTSGEHQDKEMAAEEGEGEGEAEEAEEQERDEEEEEEEEESESSESEDNSELDETYGVKRTKQSRASKSKKQRTAASRGNSSKRQSIIHPEKVPNYLFDAVMEGDAAFSELARSWLESYSENQLDSLRDFLNFVLKCCGCEVSLETHDIDNIDSAADTLSDIQNMFSRQAVYEFPMSSKSPAMKGFKERVCDFIDQIIRVAHENGMLQTDPSLMENIETWVSTISTSNLRPLRFTSTVILLRILTTSCELVAKLMKAMQRSAKQQNSGTKRTKKLQERYAKLVEDQEAQIKTLDNYIKDIVDTTFIHRYRDVDPKIRTECMKTLGKLMDVYPDHFFDGQYLRYFGWVLSDVNASTRLEVVRSLTRLYKKKEMVVGFRHFTERFKSRLVEMVLADADTSVRVHALSMMNSIRAQGFLEDEDCLKMLKLLFDSEPKIRLEATKFFRDHIAEAVAEAKSKIDDISTVQGVEGLTESMLGFKIMGEVLAEVTKQIQIQEENTSNSSDLLAVPVGVEKPDSFDYKQIELVAPLLYDQIPILSNCQDLVKYLLFDFTRFESVRLPKASTAILETLKLQPEEESILIHLLAGVYPVSVVSLNESHGKKPGDTEGESVNDAGEAGKGQFKEDIVMNFPRFISKYMSAVPSFSGLLSLFCSIDISEFQQSGRETLFAEVVSKILHEFWSLLLKPLRQISGNLILFLQKLADSSVFSDIIQSQLDESLSTLVSSLRRQVLADNGADNGVVKQFSDLSNVECEETCELVYKLVLMGSVVDISKALLYEVKDTNQGSKVTLISQLLDILDLLSLQDLRDDSELSIEKRLLQELGLQIVTLVFSYVSWLYDNAIRRRITDTDFKYLRYFSLANVLGTLHQVIQNTKNQKLRLETSIAVIDMLVGQTVTAVKLDTPENDERIQELMLTNKGLVDKLQATLFQLFLENEARYARANNILLDREENEDVYEEVDETAEAEAVDPAENWAAEVTLSRYSLKLIALHKAGLLSDRYAQRLVLNASKLGSLYASMVH